MRYRRCAAVASARALLLGRLGLPFFVSGHCWRKRQSHEVVQNAHRRHVRSDEALSAFRVLRELCGCPLPFSKNRFLNHEEHEGHKGIRPIAHAVHAARNRHAQHALQNSSLVRSRRFRSKPRVSDDCAHTRISTIAAPLLSRIVQAVTAGFSLGLVPAGHRIRKMLRHDTWCHAGS